MSFYDAAGAVDPSRLARVQQGHGADEVVGWFVSRANCPRSLSIRDRAVSDGLLRRLAGRGRLLVASISPFTDLDGTVIGTGYTFYEFRHDLEAPQALPVRIRNLASTLGRSHYEDLDFASVRAGGTPAGLSPLGKGGDRMVKDAWVLTQAMEDKCAGLFSLPTTGGPAE